MTKTKDFFITLGLFPIQLIFVYGHTSATLVHEILISPLTCYTYCRRRKKYSKYIKAWYETQSDDIKLQLDEFFGGQTTFKSIIKKGKPSFDQEDNTTREFKKFFINSLDFMNKMRLGNIFYPELCSRYAKSKEFRLSKYVSVNYSICFGDQLDRFPNLDLSINYYSKLLVFYALDKIIKFIQSEQQIIQRRNIKFI
jgi:hypothetical protein